MGNDAPRSGGGGGCGGWAIASIKITLSAKLEGFRSLPLSDCAMMMQASATAIVWQSCNATSMVNPRHRHQSFCSSHTCTLRIVTAAPHPHHSLRPLRSDSLERHRPPAATASLPLSAADAADPPRPSRACRPTRTKDREGSPCRAKSSRNKMMQSEKPPETEGRPRTTVLSVRGVRYGR